MKKNVTIKMIIITLLITLTLGLFISCGKKTSDVNENVTEEKTVEDSSEIAGGRITFKQAIEKKGPQIWYILSSIEGRNSTIEAALVFEDKKVRTFIPRDTGFNFFLGYLEEYYSLSNESAIELLQSRYEQGYREQYEYYNKEADYYDKEGTALNCYNQLKDYVIEERPLTDYKLGFLMDDTGNNVEKELFYVEYTQERRPMDRNSETEEFTGLMNDYYLPEDHEDWHRYLLIGLGTQTGPIEVYDTYFNGLNFSNEGEKSMEIDDAYAIVTKCEYDTVFTTDEKGTEGIEEIY